MSLRTYEVEFRVKGGPRQSVQIGAINANAAKCAIRGQYGNDVQFYSVDEV